MKYFFILFFLSFHVNKNLINSNLDESSFCVTWNASIIELTLKTFYQYPFQIILYFKHFVFQFQPKISISNIPINLKKILKIQKETISDSKSEIQSEIST